MRPQGLGESGGHIPGRRLMPRAISVTTTMPAGRGALSSRGRGAQEGQRVWLLLKRPGLLGWRGNWSLGTPQALALALRQALTCIWVRPVVCSERALLVFWGFFCSVSFACAAGISRTGQVRELARPCPGHWPSTVRSPGQSPASQTWPVLCAAFMAGAGGGAQGAELSPPVTPAPRQPPASYSNVCRLQASPECPGQTALI